jgi:2-amino-4-hydroxy-6-hydroxymethyldihydropteridine diphosphokinase
VIALGANLGDRLATLREAVRRIDALAPVRATSRVYETAPVGGPAQPDYLNAAILVEWEGTPIELLDRLQAIELALGRVRSVPNAPRTLVLDILWFEGTELETNRLTVPHPRLLSRAFALRPLLDVVPDAYPIPPGMIQDPGCRETSETLM